MNTFLKESNFADDTFFKQDIQKKAKVNYFNVMVAGSASSGKFNFIETFYQYGFNNTFQTDSE